MNPLIKKPSAWLPIVIPLIFLVYIVSIITFRGIPVPNFEADEGTAAHIFQLWLVAEPLMIIFFGAKYWQHEPKQVRLIMALQIIVALATCFPVFYFKF